MIDFRSHRLPNRIVLALTNTLLIEFLMLDDCRVIKNCLMVATVYFAFFMFLHLISRGNLGPGDVKYSVGCGLIVGYYALPSWLINIWLMFSVTAVVSLILLFSKQISWDTRIAFGPYMTIATVITSLNSLS